LRKEVIFSQGATSISQGFLAFKPFFRTLLGGLFQRIIFWARD
jgi:hypothetical protein